MASLASAQVCRHWGEIAYMVQAAHSSPYSQHLTGLKARLSGQLGVLCWSASFNLLVMDRVYSV